MHIQNANKSARRSLKHTLGILGVGAACPASVSGADAVPGEPAVVTWITGERESLAHAAPRAVRADIAALKSRGLPRVHALVGLDRRVSPAERAAMRSAGLELVNSLGGTAWFASLRHDADGDALAGLGVGSIAPVSPERKLHPDLSRGIVRDWMVSITDIADDPNLERVMDQETVTIRSMRDAGVDPRVAVVVMFYDDVDSVDYARRLEPKLGAKVASDIFSINGAVVHVPASRIEELARDDGVMWVEPPLPGFSTTNAENRALTGVDILHASPYLLDGTGVNVLIYDGGRMYTDHADYASRLTIGASDTDSLSGHATHVGGTVGGDGTAVFEHRGMAPGVHLISYGFQQFTHTSSLQAGFLYTDPGDLEGDYAEAISLYDAHIANNSIGTNLESNGYPCEWTGNYGVTSALIDSIVHGSLSGPFRVVWANGNERSGTRCIGDDQGNHGEYYSTAPPSAAKNHITVGAVHADTDNMTWFSSWGPTDDGRIKPDISGPGCQEGGDEGVTSTTRFDPMSYGTACGTSMAAPTVTGICALILEQYRLLNPGADDPRNATLKALLANTAVDHNTPGPDYQFGFGSVRADAAVDAVVAGNVLEGEVTQGGVYRFTVDVAPADTELRVTIAWDDVPAAPNVLTALVNDLDLRVIDPTGAVHLPWTLDPSNPSAPAVRTTQDRLNNIEQVTIDAPAPGAYTVEVIGHNVADGPTQSFGAVTTGSLTGCSSGGTIAMDATSVACDGTITVTVRDCDLDTSASIETVNVVVTSDSDPGGQVVTLTETAAGAGEFTGAFTYGASGALVTALEGDTITAVYDDLNDGAGGSGQTGASAVVDCTGAGFGGATVASLWYDSATIVVTTDEPARVLLQYGTSMASLVELGLEQPMGTVHTFPIGGLTELTTYRYAFTAVDSAGNASADDANGAGHVFRTTKGPEPVHEFLVDDTDPGWTTEGSWEFGVPTPGASDGPPSAYTGTNIYGTDLDGPYPKNLDGIEYLTTGPIDLTGVAESRIEFQRWLGLEPDVYVEASVEARAGGGEWQVIWSFSGGRLTPDEWTLYTYEVGDIVDGHSDAQFRWSVGPTGPFATECGWNIDDIVITGVVLESQCGADLDGSGALSADDIALFVNSFVGGSLVADLNGDGSLTADDIDLFVTMFIVGCP